MIREFEDIETVVIIVAFKDGSAHQVLSTKENKSLALNLLTRLDGKLSLDKELHPIEFKTKS